MSVQKTGGVPNSPHLKWGANLSKIGGIDAYQAMGLSLVVSDTVTDEMVYTDLVDYVSLASPLSAGSDHLQVALSKGSAGGVCRKIEGKPFLGCAVRGTSDGDLSADAGWKIM